MPAGTAHQNYPYPLDTDDIDVSDDMQNLAEAIDLDIYNAITLMDGKVSVTGDTMTGMLSLPGTAPTSLNHAIRKGWADAAYLNKTGDAMSGDLDMNSHNVINLGPPTGDGYATRKSYVDNQDADLVSKTVNGPGNQHMESGLEALRFIISDPDSPNGPFQATTKKYVDDLIADAVGLTRIEADARYVNIDGDVMTGPLRIGGDWASEEPGVIIRNNLGNYRSTVMSSTAGTSMVLNRSDTANAAAQSYIDFNHDVDTINGSITINDDTDSGATSGVGVDYNTTSDYRLKENFGPTEDAADRIRGLAGRVFRGSAKGGQRASRDMLNAHDIAEFAPYVVRGDKDAVDDQGRIVPQQVNYSGLIPLLVAALGSALERIDQLEARLA